MRRLAALLCLAFLCGAPLVAPAAPGGTAYDSVTKIAMGADPSSLQPGSFDDDYAAASAEQPPAASGGGLFAHMKQAMAMGQNVGKLMTTGMAERHYVAGSKERTDYIAMGTAFITDCVARTITTLNLRDKTYRIESMDHPSSATSSAPGAGAPAKDDGTRVAISIANSSLGSRVLAGQPTNGFRSVMTMTESKPAGESSTQNLDLIAYYSALPMPFPTCFHLGSASGVSPGNAMAMMGAAMHVMQSLAVAGLDKRFSLKQSGPLLPAGNIPMYEAVLYGQNGSAAFVTELGNVRPISANDPVFSVPADFTRQQ
jgi:hypothetical protein